VGGEGGSPDQRKEKGEASSRLGPVLSPIPKKGRGRRLSHHKERKGKKKGNDNGDNQKIPRSLEREKRKNESIGRAGDRHQRQYKGGEKAPFSSRGEEKKKKRETNQRVSSIISNEEKEREGRIPWTKGGRGEKKKNRQNRSLRRGGEKGKGGKKPQSSVHRQGKKKKGPVFVWINCPSQQKKGKGDPDHFEARKGKEKKGRGGVKAFSDSASNRRKKKKGEKGKPLSSFASFDGGGGKKNPSEIRLPIDEGIYRGRGEKKRR